jgi:Predicted membrane protein (DUF2306)
MHATQSVTADGSAALRWAARACYGAIALGQLAFTIFLLAYYYPRTLSGDFARWNDKPLIDGHITGDPTGNAMFAVHVLLAAVITLGGLMQLLPVIRTNWPWLHRWTGRLFIATALALALGGFWLTWVRGTHLTLAGAWGVTLNGILIAGAAAIALREAMARRIISHRRWALRLFILASGVWFMRVFYMAWGVLSGGAGIGDAMDGPADMVIAYGNSLIPLAVLEIYLFAEARGTLALRRAAAGLLWLSALVIAGGSAGAWLLMWQPHL